MSRRVENLYGEEWVIFPEGIYLSNRGVQRVGTRVLFDIVDRVPNPNVQAELVKCDEHKTYRLMVNGAMLYMKINPYIGHAYDELHALLYLASQGVHVAPVIAAGIDCIVTEEVDGMALIPGQYTDYVLGYDEVISQLVQDYATPLFASKGYNGNIVVSDVKEEHLIPRDLSNDNPLEWFHLIDGVKVALPIY